MYSNSLGLILQPVSWLSLVLLIVTGGGLIVYYDKEKKRHIEGSFLLSMSIPFTFSLSTGWPLRQELTKNLVCGGIHLVRTPLDLEFLKLAAAVYFSEAKTGMEVVPVFISVDPERDNVEQVHEYVKGALSSFFSLCKYLMNPNMEFVKFFGKNYDADALTEGVIKEIKGQ
ncbi:hypothetical protein GW17_00003309 [Ensete ventricosum]|nr:hypothetical protein GW17_00003309 [Ensete ventricosum]